ncbi:MAG: cation transporter [Acinetobacter sp.]
MFQGFWNVAAAFCGHENLKMTNIENVQSHFGHHVALHCENDSIDKKASLPTESADLTLSTDFLNNFQDDHRDHLPSFAHFIAADVQQQADQPRSATYIESAFIGWENLYQSPHLFLQNPPPISTPL